MSTQVTLHILCSFCNRYILLYFLQAEEVWYHLVSSYIVPVPFLYLQYVVITISQCDLLLNIIPFPLSTEVAIVPDTFLYSRIFISILLLIILWYSGLPLSSVASQICVECFPNELNIPLAIVSREPGYWPSLLEKYCLSENDVFLLPQIINISCII